MRIIRSLAEAGSSIPSVVTAGNFDGVHRGHQAILSKVRESASRHNAQSVTITFEPHPLACIAPERAPTPISTLEQKTRLIEDFGIDLLLIQAFTEEFSRLSAEAFIETYLISGFKARALCVGHNFRFGHGHRGDIHTLRRLKSQVEVIEVPAVMVRGRPVSSSRIRETIVQGRAREARRLLGHCYEILGRIVAGKGRGTKLTVPTLNLAPDNDLLPIDGVYLTQTAVEDGHWVDSVTNIGVRPTFSETERTVECHLLNRVPPPDAARTRLRFIARLRDEEKFPSADALAEQIRRDKSYAERFFRRLDHVRQTEALECASENPR